MKYCSKCGVPSDDSAVFCSACGERFAVVGQPVMQNQNMQTAQTSQSALSLLKKHGSSTLFLTTICVYAAMLVFSLINILNPHSYIIKYFDYIAQLVQVNSSAAAANIFFNLSNTVYLIQLIVGLIFFAIPVLIGVGLLFTYLLSKDKSQTGIKTTGLSIIKVVVTIQLVFFCVVIGIGLLILLIGIIASAVSSYNGAGTVAMIVFLSLFVIIILGGIAAFVIIYYAKILSTIKTVVATARTGNTGKKVSVFVPVVNIIGAAGTLFSLVMSLIFMPVYNNLITQYNQSSNIYGDFYFPYGYNSTAPTLPQLPGIDAITAGSLILSAAFLIMISIVIFKYRDAIAKLTYNMYIPYTPNMPNIQNSQPFSYPAYPTQITQAPTPHQSVQTQQPPIQQQQPERQEQPQNNSPFVPPDDSKDNNDTTKE
ncbi:MAG: zinc ribbon domain-containing protein [Oscillospiraceae bacterium]|nr:zinc ribbon domain-containing protein [Oscillospiraceae bacterium]